MQVERKIIRHVAAIKDIGKQLFKALTQPNGVMGDIVIFALGAEEKHI